MTKTSSYTRRDYNIQTQLLAYRGLFIADDWERIRGHCPPAAINTQVTVTPHNVGRHADVEEYENDEPDSNKRKEGTWDVPGDHELGKPDISN